MILGLVAIFAIAAQSGPPLPRPLLLNGVHRIACLGDSITQFGGQKGGYVWLVDHYLQHLYGDIEVVNAGISGNKSNDMLARFQKDVLDKEPDLVTISVGVNDVWHGFSGHPLGDGPNGIPLPIYKANVGRMVDSALAQGVRIVILSATVIYEDLNSPENRKAQGYNAALREIAANRKLPYIDLQAPFRAMIADYRAKTGARDNLLTLDGVHMNEQGNKVMAHTILTGLGISPALQQSVQGAVEQDQG